MRFLARKAMHLPTLRRVCSAPGWSCCNGCGFVTVATGAWGLFWHVTLSPRAAWGLFWHVSLSPHRHVCGVCTACSVFASSQLCAGSTSSQLCVAHSARHSNASLAGCVDAQSFGCARCVAWWTVMYLDKVAMTVFHGPVAYSTENERC